MGPASAPEAVVEALVTSLHLLAGALGLGWSRRVGRVWAVVTEVPAPTMNGVWATSADTSAREIEAAAEAVSVHRIPYCIQARPECRAAAAEAADRRAMLIAPEIPLMTAVGAVSGAQPRELAVRRLEETESGLHAELAGRAFGAPPELFESIITETTLALPAARGYVGEVNGHPVCTAIAVTQGDAVGVFNVATTAEYRRRGYGAAVTARAISDGREAGATWSWLQASEVGRGAYERLGFHTLERWACWVAA